MSSYRHFALFVALAFIWGSLFVFIKIGLPYVPPVLFAALRHDLAAVLTLAYAAAVSEQWRPRSRADWWLVGLGATFFVGLYNAFLFVGQGDVTSSIAAILTATNPILAAMFAWVLIPAERLSKTGVVGLFLGFVGVGLVANPDLSGPLGAETVGAGLVILSTACLAFGSVLVQRASGDLSTAGFVGWSNLLGAGLLHVVSLGLPSESLSAVDLTGEALFAIVYLAVVGSGLSAIIYFHLLHALGAVEINLVSYAAPIFTAVLGWLLLAETLSPLSVLGFLTIFAGFALVKNDELRAEARKLSWQSLGRS
ncbi:DMT family transporter [Halosolutus amylolyticus]|uniref:DMT family transporter n=1 Tax=Halosolutus amylolyticus TaxID=2932267 RepID=A0ABD5PR83_9EURY|nr:DMT family transporter [Halosolutus amylolyticus]